MLFTGYLSHEDLKDYLSKASMVIINKYRNQQNEHCFSTKLGEYLAAAKPVIITNVGEAMNWLENGRVHTSLSQRTQMHMPMLLCRRLAILMRLAR